MARNGSGNSYPGVICKLCGTTVRIIHEPDKIPNRFSRRCPKCRTLNAYHWEDIHIIEDRREG